MIALIVLGVVILLILVLLFSPIKLRFSYDDDFRLKVKYLGIKIFDTEEKPKKKKTKSKKKKDKGSNKAPSKKENFIVRTYKQRGLTETIKYFSEILVIAFKKIRPLIKRLQFRKFSLNIVVATDDAANTAIQYGRVCAAVYPAMTFLQSTSDFKAKNIDVSTDFSKTKSSFKISGLVKAKLLYLLIAAISFIIEFLKIERKESEQNERKQSKSSNGNHNGKSKSNG